LIGASADEARDEIVRLPQMGKVALARAIVGEVCARIQA
jgi:hypothetical protein